MKRRGRFSRMDQGFIHITGILIFLFSHSAVFSQNYPIVGTGQLKAYNNLQEIPVPVPGGSFYGQNANYSGIQPSYTDNGNGTITDNQTGLMWQKSPDLNGDHVINADDKLTYQEALSGADTLSLGGYSDWRLPTIKELYSLFMANGTDPSGYTGTSTSGLIPFIDTGYFDFGYGDQNAGERIIDAQYATKTIYVSTVFNGAQALFGVNFADGRIKGYPKDQMPGQTQPMKFYVKYVRGNTSYGINHFHDNGDSTITDLATGLTWMQYDNGAAISWENALSFAENFSFAGHNDWRLPDVKELQSILDYTRSPATTSSAAIDPLFSCSQIMDEGNNSNYPFFWTSTTHANWTTSPGGSAMYVCFGEALGWMEMPPQSGMYTLMDVHGAGAQRSDFKVGNPASYPYGHGPQGDVVRIYHYVRLVRGTSSPAGIPEDHSSGSIEIFPNPSGGAFQISSPGTDSEIRIYNMAGQLVATGHASANIRTGFVLPEDGLYYIRCEIPSGIFVKKLVINSNL